MTDAANLHFDLCDTPLTDRAAIHQLVNLCAELQSDITALRAQVAELTAMRDTLNAVFTIEAPAAICPACEGFGDIGDGVTDCAECNGTGKVQP